jgi:DNA-binding CsgD family transcriptional regulator
MSRFGYEHIMTVPLLGGDQIIGTINYGRARGEPHFVEADTRLAGALGAHVSVLLARLQTSTPVPGLTPREVTIARHVAAGLNNAEIAICLSISRDTVKAALKRLFAKLEVQARAEMVARLTAAWIA